MKEVDFREAADIYKPENVVFVISCDKEGKPNGMVAAWNMKCSFDPPLMAVSLQKKGNTHRLIRESKEFVIAVPNKAMEKDLRFFGSNHGHGIDKFKETGIAVESANIVKCPLLSDATLNFECKMINEVEAGDHYIYVGEVVASYVNEGKGILLAMPKKDGERVFQEF